MSSPDEQPLCEKCGTRPATNFLCTGGTSVSSSLCDECLEAAGPVSAGFAAEVKAARCRYCGGHPCSGGTDIFPLTTAGVQEFRWMCMSCAMEYYSHVQAAFAGIAGTHLTAVKQVERLREMQQEAERHMKEFVRSRDN